MIRNTTFFISDLNERSENQIHLSSNLSKTINGLPFSLEIELNDYLRYNNADTRFEKTDLKILSFSPSTFISKYGIDFDLAVDFDFMSDDSPFQFFPAIKATKELVKDILLVWGGLRHSEQRHTLKSLSDENPYIHSFGTNQSILGGNSFPQQLKTTDIDLTSSGLTGSIPPEIGCLTNLTYLRLDNNQLTGEIPQQVCDLIESNNLDIENILYGNNLTNTCD